MQRVFFLLAALIPFLVSAKPPNIVFIISDDQTWTDYGFMGHKQIETPNIDRLATQSLTFTHGYVPSSLCCPSLATMITGLYPHQSKITGNEPPIPKGGKRTPEYAKRFQEQVSLIDRVPSLPRILKEKGYVSHQSGKWWEGSYQRGGFTEGMSRGFPNPGGRHGDAGLKISRDGMKPIVDFISEAKQKKKPFFLAVGFWKPHLPFNAPKRYWDMYDRNQIALPDNPKPPTNVPKIALHDAREMLRSFKGKPPTPAQVRELRHGYYAATTYMDAQIGKVLAELDRLGLRENTIITFASDHGFHLGEHKLWAKTSCFEWDAAVPMIIAPPKLAKPGAPTHALAELLDLYPTIVELAGLPTPKHLEGTSLLPVLKNPAASVKQAAYTQHPRPAYYKGAPEAMGYSMRTTEVRYTEWRNWKTGKIIARELYDHRKDPGENHNIAATQGGPVQKLSDRMSIQFPVRAHP